MFSKLPLNSIDNANNSSLTYYEIQKGDSLWSIADQFNSKNKELFIYKIKKINNLSNSSLVVNDILLIP
jgi:LysM repeat protein